jgi:hypothetical protein
VLPRNLQQDNVHPHYANDALLDVEVTVPPGFNPVQVATELGSSASNVYSLMCRLSAADPKWDNEGTYLNQDTQHAIDLGWR